MVQRSLNEDVIMGLMANSMKLMETVVVMVEPADKGDTDEPYSQYLYLYLATKHAFLPVTSSYKYQDGPCSTLVESVLDQVQERKLEFPIIIMLLL